MMFRKIILDPTGIDYEKIPTHLKMAYDSFMNDFHGIGKNLVWVDKDERFYVIKISHSQLVDKYFLFDIKTFTEGEISIYRLRRGCGYIGIWNGDWEKESERMFLGAMYKQLSEDYNRAPDNTL